MSYFQVVEHDPPTFVVGFSVREMRPKDTLVNMRETRDCVLNLDSEHMVEAVNASSIDVAYGVSEWALSGLEAAGSSTVAPARVKDGLFSIEGKAMEVRELEYHGHGKAGRPTGSSAIIGATRF
jgi:flavin reductase (DIM6/NTAB) family NADH-FMN oxidoreductase RutF